MRVRERGEERPGGKRRENREGEKCGRKRFRELERQSSEKETGKAAPRE